LYSVGGLCVERDGRDGGTTISAIAGANADAGAGAGFMMELGRCESYYNVVLSLANGRSVCGYCLMYAGD
jgi:hypothetical protein